MAKVKRGYTTGDVARLCGVAARTVTKWCDSGVLPNWRIPGSLDRRITADSLARFMAENGFPADMIEAVSPTKPPTLLYVGMESHPGFAVDYAVTHIGNVFEAGVAFADGPSIVVVDLGIGRLDASLIASVVSGRGVPCAAYTADTPEPGKWRDFCAFLPPSLPEDAMAYAIRVAVACHAESLKSRRAS